MPLARVLIVAVVALVPALAGLPGAASAGTTSVAEPRGDVRYVGADDEGGFGGSSTGIPTRRQGDIVRLEVDHTATAVRALVRFRQLNRTGESHLHWLVFRSPGVRLDVFVQIEPGNWQGSTLLYRNNKQVRCRTTATISYRGNWLRFGVPRACLGNPEWVRVSAETSITAGTHVFYDKALQRGGAYASPAPYGPATSS